MAVAPQADRRVVWGYWVACAFAALAAVIPLVLTGSMSGRMSAAAIPMGVATILMGANALTGHRGRPMSAALYFVAGIAIAYSMLALAAVPIRLTVIGTCPAPPAPCPTGLEQALSGTETNALTAVFVLGMLSIGAGFFALLMLYRRKQPV